MISWTLLEKIPLQVKTALDLCEDEGNDNEDYDVCLGEDTAQDGSYSSGSEVKMLNMVLEGRLYYKQLMSKAKFLNITVILYVTISLDIGWS